MAYRLSRIQYLPIQSEPHTFLHSNLGGTRLGFLLCRRILVLLHTPYLLCGLVCV